MESDPHTVRCGNESSLVPALEIVPNPHFELLLMLTSTARILLNSLGPNLLSSSVEYVRRIQCRGTSGCPAFNTLRHEEPNSCRVYRDGRRVCGSTDDATPIIAAIERIDFWRGKRRVRHEWKHLASCRRSQCSRLV